MFRIYDDSSIDDEELLYPQLPDWCNEPVNTYGTLNPEEIALSEY